ncbi:hypothetical protein C4D60_Mb08t26050 [Musa balbisiana]|uniref:Uncharacterized protein n=1 Tax=Musa balbisiana TaxID=52838 RepID=A0A4S8K6L4_MUSBA|nr:hypothetical protein C4D60_Mb08t26050 [Musa balbisiana]
MTAAEKIVAAPPALFTARRRPPQYLYGHLHTPRTLVLSKALIASAHFDSVHIVTKMGYHPQLVLLPRSVVKAGFEPKTLRYTVKMM